MARGSQRGSVWTGLWGTVASASGDVVGVLLVSSANSQRKHRTHAPCWAPLPQAVTKPACHGAFEDEWLLPPSWLPNLMLIPLFSPRTVQEKILGKEGPNFPRGTTEQPGPVFKLSALSLPRCSAHIAALQAPCPQPSWSPPARPGLSTGSPVRLSAVQPAILPVSVGVTVCPH